MSIIYWNQRNDTHWFDVPALVTIWVGFSIGTLFFNLMINPSSYFISVFQEKLFISRKAIVQTKKLIIFN